MPHNKSFWQRPEGIAGAIFLVGLLAGATMLLSSIVPVLIALAQNTLYLAGMLAVLGMAIYVVFDPKMRNLVWYMYKSAMRWLTGLFIQIDPIKILKSYIEDLEKSLRKLSRQIGSLRGQMRQLKSTMDANALDIRKNLTLADQAQKKGDEKTMTLSARKAGRMKEANEKYQVLYQKMDVLYKVLTKMYEDSEIMLEDTKDQVHIKEQEYVAIRTSHSAIESAMSIMKGSPDQRAMFDQALEALAEEVSSKVGRMERFMDTSKNLMASIDLQSGVFADEGMRLLEEWQQENGIVAPDTSSKKKKTSKTEDTPLDINQAPPEPLKQEKDNSDYKRLFD